VTNRLGASTSPYLLQHAGNPVDWWEWSPEAFAEARSRDVPVLLSVGYSACHWCHVMAHESFEDPATAEVMNAGFVNVKVDREERPDVDAVYMAAVQQLTGHGGWPMTVFLTPDAQPFYAGTYFPPRPHHGSPSFTEVLHAVDRTWRERRADVLIAGQRLVAHLAAAQTVPPELAEAGPPDEAELAEAVRALASSYDAVRGGFGGAPKFPPSMTLEHLLRHHARTGDADALVMAERTFEAMARGGIYDQLAGGFARYSVDAGWVVPHFEKMLYDNALLARAYLHWWRATGHPLGRRIAEETCDFLVADLRTAEGGFASALDADSGGEEGRHAVWTPAQLAEVLGPEDGAWAAALLGVTSGGTFEHGTSTLQLPADPDDAQRWHAVRGRLLAARSTRVQPGRDDKVVAAWNGLAIAALAETGALLGRTDLVEAAEAAADLLVSVHLGAGEHGDRLVRVSLGGVAGAHAGVREDHADVAEGLLALYQCTGEEEWLAFAGVLLDVVLAHFADGHGGFHDTADDAEALVARPQDPGDNATPSGWTAAAQALLTYAALTGSEPHRAAAERALGVVRAIGPRHPRAIGWGLAAAEAALDGPREVAVVGSRGDAAASALLRTALMGAAPGLVVAVGDPAEAPGVALLRDRPLVGGRAAAYVCRRFVCAAPVTTPEELAALVG
jgi:hypothetical protein